MNNEVAHFILIMLVVAALMLLGELLHRIFRAPKSPQRETAPVPIELADETFEDRYSIRHLESFFLIHFASFLSFLLLLARGLGSELHILIVGVVGVWWAFRRGVLR